LHQSHFADEVSATEQLVDAPQLAHAQYRIEAGVGTRTIMRTNGSSGRMALSAEAD
jgi:hypothetical protein